MSIVQTKGIIFPLELTTGKHTLVEQNELIKASIKIILTWPLFTRYYEDEFGSRIHEVLEDQNDDILISLVRRFVVDAISKWEKRITLQRFSIDRRSYDKLYLELIYRINDINIEDTLTYYFYTN